jgi:hypothetical protein
MMDDRLFEEMLQEIDAMTSEEYWSLYREAEKLVNFPPEDTGFIPVQFTTIPIVNSHYNFDNTFDTEAIPIPHNYCQETLLVGDDVWPKAA